MEERDIQLIEKYLAHDLTTAEVAEVERRLISDMEFRKIFDEYKLAAEALRLAHRDELKSRFRERDKILDKKTNVNSTPNTRLLWWLGAIVFSLLLLWFFITKQGPSETVINQTEDTLQVNEQKVDNPDTLRIEKNNDQPRADGNNRKQTKSIRDKASGKELYAANFEPYPGDDLENITRGSKDPINAYERFQLNYVEKEYESSLEAFNDMSASMQENDNLLFLKANALLALKRYSEAITILERVSKSNKSGYQVEALYYLALAELQRENIDRAKVLLDQYVQDTRAIEQNRAREILKEINTD